ncbi:unnamed protein product, partial [marine sediment metagenome]
MAIPKAVPSRIGIDDSLAGVDDRIAKIQQALESRTRVAAGAGVGTGILSLEVTGFR